MARAIRFLTNLIIILPLLFVSACENGGHFLFDDPSYYDYQESGPTRHAVFFESAPTIPAMHEPSHGTMIGFYTDALPGLDGRIIAPVQSALGVSHAAFVEVISLGDDFPTLWILECIAEHKLPVIIILPPEEGDPFGDDWETVLTETAVAFSEFSMPMLVVFYPISDLPDPATYIAFFRYARALFAIHAPHVAFVWAVDSGVSNFMDFFPGKLAADWVGLSLFTNPEEFSIDMLRDFYYTFQNDMPIMLNLGLGHFSITDHRYRITETAFAMEKIYRAILDDFPRIRLVNYMDVNRTDFTGYDYRIRMDIGLRGAYRDSVRRFITEKPRQFDDELFVFPVRSAYTALVEDERIYLDVSIFNEIGIPINVPVERARWVDGIRMVDSERIGVLAELYRGNVYVLIDHLTDILR